MRTTTGNLLFAAFLTAIFVGVVDVWIGSVLAEDSRPLLIYVLSFLIAAAIGAEVFALIHGTSAMIVLGIVLGVVFHLMILPILTPAIIY